MVCRLEEQQNWSELHSRRALRAEARTRKRKRNMTLFAVLVLLVILTVTFVTLGAVSGKKGTPKPATVAKKKTSKATSSPAKETAPQAAGTTAPATPPVVSESPPPAAAPPPAPTRVAPVDGKPVYPYTRDGSIACGKWSAGSDDYPFFGAPRSGGRLHGAIDVYPPAGRGAPVKAIKDGTVVQVIPAFYTRADGEVCYGILIDHGDFVAFYGEMASPAALSVGQTVKTGQQIGTVSGTVQLHFEMYTPGTRARGNWYGSQPANLQDPTQFMLGLTG